VKYPISMGCPLAVHFFKTRLSRASESIARDACG
jgi:hypothetical protein